MPAPFRLSYPSLLCIAFKFNYFRKHLFFSLISMMNDSWISLHFVGLVPIFRGCESRPVGLILWQSHVPMKYAFLAVLIEDFRMSGAGGFSQVFCLQF